MWNTINNIPVHVTQALDTIFSAILVGGLDRSNPDHRQILLTKVPIAKQSRAAFIGEYPFNVFYNGYAIFYDLIVNRNMNTFTKEQLAAVLDNSRELIPNSPYVNITQYQVTANGNIADEDDIISAVTSDTVELFERLSRTIVSEDEYMSQSVFYKDWYKSALAEYTSHAMVRIMTDEGFEEKKVGRRSRTYHGLNDLQEFYNDKMRIIKSLSEESQTRSCIIDDSWLEEEMKKEGQADRNSLFTVGIKEIDDVMGELRRSNLVTVLGPPKGGKTRFSAYLAERALEHGYNVTIWPVEGTRSEWESMLTASLLASLSYKATKSGQREGMLRISSKDILLRRYSTRKDLRAEILSAKTLLACSGDLATGRGRLSFIEGNAYVEDMFDILKAHYDNDNKFDVLIIDQLVNVQSHHGKGKVETISRAYMECKNFITNVLPVPALGIMPAQLKQEVVNELRSGKTEIIDVTAGGESAETIRSADEAIGLFSDESERRSNIMKFYSVASRHNENFPKFQARCYLECCYFMSENDSVR